MRPRLRALLAAAAAALPSLAGGCDAAGPARVDAAAAAPGFVDAAVYDPLDTSDAGLGTRVRDLFGSARCAGGAETYCHGVGAGDLHLRLGAGGDVVGVPASGRPDLRRITPFDAERSYLYLKVRGDGGIDGDVMPKGAPPDPRIERLVADWIEAGAPEP